MLRLPQPKQELDPVVSSILNQRNAQNVFGSGIEYIFYLLLDKVYATKYIYAYFFAFLSKIFETLQIQ